MPTLHLEVGELSLERNHGVSRIGDGDSTKGGNRSRDGISAQEAEDSELCQTSVVDLLDETSLLLLSAHVLVEAEGVEEVEHEVHVITEEVERRVLSGLTSGHVVGHLSATALVPKLEHGDDEEDLPLGANRDGIPLLLRAEVRAGVGGTGEGLGPGEDNVGLDNVPNEGSHGNTSVLDLGLTKEANGGLVTLSPEVSIGKAHGVEVVDDGVALGSDGLEVGLGLLHDNAGAGGGLGGSESGGGSQKGKGGGELHYC
mmetsp:Transcript_16187/g.25260  ORF Transcript_16187/g.25260 Transcript_16187/m.25260 type:complete len:257 (-) Transcript_16187:29-799(-)